MPSDHKLLVVTLRFAIGGALLLTGCAGQADDVIDSGRVEELRSDRICLVTSRAQQEDCYTLDDATQIEDTVMVGDLVELISLAEGDGAVAEVREIEREKP